MLRDSSRTGTLTLVAFMVALVVCGVAAAAATDGRIAKPFGSGPAAVETSAGLQAAPGLAAFKSSPTVFTSGGSLTVDDDLVECPGAGFTTIQAAVDQAALQPGTQKIKVCPGVYPENVLVGAGNPVKIEGDGAGITVVTGVAGTAGPIIDVVSAGKVEVDRLTVDGLSALAGGVVTGIRYDETDGKIYRVEVLNIRNASGSSQGIGIRIQSSTGAPAKVKVMKSLVRNYTRVGINGNGAGVDLTVQQSDIVGPVPPTVWAPNGVQMSRGARGKVAKNVVDNNPSPNVPGGAGSGIILFCSGPTRVYDNLVTRADLGISIVDTAGARVHKNDIIDSDFDGISMQFLGLFFGNIGCTAPGAPLPVEDNKIDGNAIAGSGDTGISLVNFDPATDAANPNDNEIERNDIVDSGFDGIHVFDGTANELDKNDIQASGSTDAVDDTIGLGTAGTANFWDKNDCTTSSPAGLCD